MATLRWRAGHSVNDMKNQYRTITHEGGAGWREALTRDLNQYPGIRRILEQHDDDSLHRLMTNLAGHDMQAVLDAFEGVEGDQPTCFIAYTIKGRGLPFAGHKDNHSGLMTVEQMAGFKQGMGIADGQEWEKFAGLSVAIVTPFRDGRVDSARLKTQIDDQVAGGVTCICPVGTTGESPTLSHEEHERVIAESIQAAAGRILVMPRGR